MKGIAIILILSVFISSSQSVVLSWEESIPGKLDYRFFYFDIPAYDDSTFTKPYFGIIDGLLHRPYGTLGSLVCPTSIAGVAVYKDTDGDDYKEWTCESINVLPFAEQPTEANPPICPSTTPSGSPALFNKVSGEWECSGENYILTLAQRNDLASPCGTADFMTYDGLSDLILCIDPHDIDESKTANGKRGIETRVDVDDDAKWFVVNSQIESTNLKSNTWSKFKWVPDISYDFSQTYSLQPSPPVALPFESQVIAASFATFKMSGYLFQIAPPTGTNGFTARVLKLSSSLGETVVQNSLSYNSVTATTGQVTFGLSTLAASKSAIGETFVADYSGLTWTVFTASTDRLVVSITLWIQTKESFTDFFFVKT